MVAGFAAPVTRDFVEFTNPLVPQSDRLPASFVSNWPTWVLDTTNGDNPTWQKIPDSDGFVAPTSISELWQPQDLKTPQLRLALGLHCRDGTIRHILPAVDLSFEGEHRNRGLCSVPRAYEWMDFGAAMAGGIDVYSMTLQFKEDGETDTWTTLAEVEAIEESLSAAVEALSETPPDDLGDGSSLVHVICDLENDNRVVPCPKPGSELRVLLEEDGDVVGTLQVAIEKTAAGSESDYLPEAYKPLFENDDFRRPAFTEAKKRIEDMEERAREREERANTEDD